MKILIQCRFSDSKAESYASELKDFLVSIGHEPIISTKNLHDKDQSLFSPSDKPDLVVVIGGDGTILLVTQRMPVQVPIVGINYGEVGFLADLDPEVVFDTLRALKEPLVTEPRMRIEIDLNGRYVGTALNEALIVTDRPAKMLKFLIHINGKIAERFRADGLIISTPTGSTAYAMSSGGPIVDPRVFGFLLVPLAPFMLSNRPHLIDSTREVSITLKAQKASRLVIDGQIDIHIDSGSIVDIRKSPEPALFLDVGQNFFEKINRKLRHL